ncbi:hypothetical protein JZ751_009495 [Albula glossodonta]|uniref:Atrophin-1 n=1 Tax=Albula glossodonta TaxID=121402 RepID=A0A8T2NXA1_9TELE|nr:hypothetical protein JZ751_009495 [Albula glossodonta]
MSTYSANERQRRKSGRGREKGHASLNIIVGGGGGAVRRGGAGAHTPVPLVLNGVTGKQASVEDLAGGRVNRRSQGHDSSESEGEGLVPPPKRQKAQDSSSSNQPPPPHPVDTSTTIPPPPSGTSQSRESDNEDGQSQGSRSSVGGSLANSSSSLSSGRDIDQDNRSSSPSLSASPLASLDSESDSPDSPKQGQRERDRGREGAQMKSGGDERRATGRGEESGGLERRDGDGAMEDDAPILKTSSSLAPSLRGMGDSVSNGSNRKSYFSLESKLTNKDYPNTEGTPSGNRVSSKTGATCAPKGVSGGPEYSHANPGAPHPPPLPPPPALKPLELGQNLQTDSKPDKMERGDKAVADKTTPPSLLPQITSLPQPAPPPPPPPPHPHHYSPVGWTTGGMHPGTEKERGREEGEQGSGRDGAGSGSGSGPGQGARDYGPAFPSRERDREREREPGREFALQNQSQTQARDFNPSGSGHPKKEKEGGRWGEFTGQLRDAGGNGNPNNSSNNGATAAPSSGSAPALAGGLPTAPLLGRDASASPQSSNPSHPPSLAPISQPQGPSNRDYPPPPSVEFSLQQQQQIQSSQSSSSSSSSSSGSDALAPHFLREYPPAVPPSSVPLSAPAREYPSPTSVGVGLGRDYPGGPQLPLSSHPHYPGQTAPSQGRERDRERERDGGSAGLYSNRSGQPPSLSPSSSSSCHPRPPSAPYPAPPPPPLPPPSSSLSQPLPPSSLGGGGHTRPGGAYHSSNQTLTPPTPLSPLPSPSANQIPGFPSFPPSSSANAALPTSGPATTCSASFRPSPYHSGLSSHTSFNASYHTNGNGANNLASNSSNSGSASAHGTASGSNSNSNTHSHSLSPQSSTSTTKIHPSHGNPGNSVSVPPSSTSLPGEGLTDSSTAPPPPPVIKEEPMEEREETDSPPPILRSPSPDPKPVDIPIHASQSARFHRVLDRGSGNSCARSDVLFVPLDGGKTWTEVKRGGSR